MRRSKTLRDRSPESFSYHDLRLRELVHEAGTWPRGLISFQTTEIRPLFAEKIAGGDEVRRVEAFREPGQNGHEHGARAVAAPPRQLERGKACRGPQLERLRLPGRRIGDRGQEQRLGVGRRTTSRKHYLALE